MGCGERCAVACPAVADSAPTDAITCARQQPAAQQGPPGRPRPANSTDTSAAVSGSRSGWAALGGQAGRVQDQQRPRSCRGMEAQCRPSQIIYSTQNKIQSDRIYSRNTDPSLTLKLVACQQLAGLGGHREADVHGVRVKGAAGTRLTRDGEGHVRRLGPPVAEGVGQRVVQDEVAVKQAGHTEPYLGCHVTTSAPSTPDKKDFRPQ